MGGTQWKSEIPRIPRLVPRSFHVSCRTRKRQEYITRSNSCFSFLIVAPTVQLYANCIRFSCPLIILTTQENETGREALRRSRYLCNALNENEFAWPKGWKRFAEPDETIGCLWRPLTIGRSRAGYASTLELSCEHNELADKVPTNARTINAVEQ